MAQNKAKPKTMPIRICGVGGESKCQNIITLLEKQRGGLNKSSFTRPPKSKHFMLPGAETIMP